MPSSPLSSTATLLDYNETNYEEDYSDLEPEEQAERSSCQPQPAFWPDGQSLQEDLAAKRLGVARQNATVFRARRLSKSSHGLEEPERFFSTGNTAVDDLLAGGLQRNELVEVVGWRSSGRFSLTLSTLASATQMGESAALVDLGDQLDPQAALNAGIDLERLLWLRPQHVKQALGATELLIGAGFSLVVLDLGQPPVRGGRGAEAGWLRLQRGVIDHHCALLVSSPYRASGTAAHAVLELHGGRGGWLGRSREPRILNGLVGQAELAKSRLTRTKNRITDPHSPQQPQKRGLQQRRKVEPHHLFELTFVSGLAEPAAPLPKLQPRKRRVKSSLDQSSLTLASGGLRYAG